MNNTIHFFMKRKKEPVPIFRDYVVFYEVKNDKNSTKWDMLWRETGEKAGDVEFFKDKFDTYVYNVFPQFKRLSGVWVDLRKLIKEKSGHDIAKF